MEEVLLRAKELVNNALNQFPSEGSFKVELANLSQNLSGTLQNLSVLQKRNLGTAFILLLLSTLVRQKKAALLSLFLNLVVFRFHAWPLRSDKYYDSIGSITHLSLAIFSVLNNRSGGLSHAQVLNTLCSTAWAVRLGTFLFTRILASNQDSRFKDIKNNYDALLFAFLAQSLWCFVGQLPLLVSNARPDLNKSSSAEAKLSPTRSSTTSYALYGRLLFVAGFLCEVVSDAQKTAFRAQFPDKFISQGLWKYSRHPNYLGEIALQFGLTLSCCYSVATFQGSDYLAWLSPVLTTVLLTKGSGIPLLEAAGIKRWGADADYQKYLRDTPVLIPRLI